MQLYCLTTDLDVVLSYIRMDSVTIV